MAAAKKVEPASVPDLAPASPEPASVPGQASRLGLGYPPRLSVCAKQAGFRRAGRAWPSEAEIVATDDFTDEQLSQLLTEPMLVVLPIADGE